MARHDIVFDHVEKSYGDVRVIRDLSLTVREGERLAILGSSGCGKSTTLRMVAGLEEITGGDLLMGGTRVNDIPAGERGVSMVFQNYALYPHMTVADNVTYALRVHKVDKEEVRRRLDNALDILGLSEYRDRKPRELSGGQRQRVALARAIVKRSPYLLLDEPLSNLDAQLRVQARKELVKIHQMFGQTMLYVTHDQVEAMTIGDRIALFDRGELQMVDTPFRVYNRPANVFVAKFIGSPSMNILDASACDGDLAIGTQRVALPEMWRDVVRAAGVSRVQLGVRPERLSVADAGAPASAAALCGEVLYTEDYGNRLGIYVSVGDAEVVAMCLSSEVREGDRVALGLDFDHIHLFDAATGKSLPYPRQLEEMETIGEGQVVA